MILLRKEQRKKQNGERDNFYLQMLSNESKMKLNLKENVLEGYEKGQNTEAEITRSISKFWRIEDDENI